MIDFWATEAHYVDHLVPVWRELQAQRAHPSHGVAAGTFFAAGDAARRLDELSIAHIEGYDHRSDLLVVAAHRDQTKIPTRPVVLVEHGIGQSYGDRHPAYTGGRSRDHYAMILAPNQRVADAAPAHVPAPVVGSGRFQELLALARSMPLRMVRQPTVGISFHWRCDLFPEAGTALDEYAPHMPDLVAQLRRNGWRVYGHAHPRIEVEARAMWEAAGVEFLSRFEDVVRLCDVYACDNSSTLFEWAALGRPVVLLNSAQYRRGVDFGLRFWEWADIGVQVDDPLELPERVWDAWAAERARTFHRRRTQLRRQFYPFHQDAARRAVRALVALQRQQAA